VSFFSEFRDRVHTLCQAQRGEFRAHALADELGSETEAIERELERLAGNGELERWLVVRCASCAEELGRYRAAEDAPLGEPRTCPRCAGTTTVARTALEAVYRATPELGREVPAAGRPGRSSRRSPLAG
jgi:hypothetical protein